MHWVYMCLIGLHVYDKNSIILLLLLLLLVKILMRGAFVDEYYVGSYFNKSLTNQPLKGVMWVSHFLMRETTKVYSCCIPLLIGVFNCIADVLAAVR